MKRLTLLTMVLLLASLAGFSGLFVWLLAVETRLARVSRQRQEDVL